MKQRPVSVLVRGDGVRPRRQQLTERDRRDLRRSRMARCPRRRGALEVAARRLAGPARQPGRQRRAVGALRAIELDAPAGLRDGLAAEARARRAPAVRPARLGGRRGGGGSGRAGDRGARRRRFGRRRSTRPPVSPRGPRRAPAPPPRPDQPTLLAAEAEGLAYPDWSGEFGWRASGERADRLGDRDATTVSTQRRRQPARLHDRLRRRARARGRRRATVDGVELAVSRDGDRTVVTWLRDGHTCVLSGPGVPRRSCSSSRPGRATGRSRSDRVRGPP